MNIWQVGCIRCILLYIFPFLQHPVWLSLLVLLLVRSPSPGPGPGPDFGPGPTPTLDLDNSYSSNLSPSLSAAIILFIASLIPLLQQVSGDPIRIG